MKMDESHWPTILLSEWTETLDLVTLQRVSHLLS